MITTSDGDVYEDEMFHAMDVKQAANPVTTDSPEAKQMTHEPEKSNAAVEGMQNFVRGIGAFVEGGLHGLAKQQGMKVPEFSDKISSVLNSPEANAALGTVSGGGVQAFQKFMDEFKLNSILTHDRERLSTVAEHLKSGKVDEARQLSGNILDEAERKFNAFIGGYTTPVFHGTRNAWEPNPDTGELGLKGRTYASTNPELANLYAGISPKFAQKDPFDIPHWAEAPEGSRVMPMLWNTEEFHDIDAQGKTWSDFMSKMHQEMVHAEDTGKPGMVVRNIYDEPTGDSKELKKPNDVYIAFKGNIARSKFAKFDPSKFDLNDLVASGSAIIRPHKTDKNKQ